MYHSKSAMQPAHHINPRSTPALGIADYALFLPSICLTCGLGVSLRLIGPAFVLVPVVTCFLYAAACQVAPPLLLTAYTGFCLLVAGLSALQVMPTSWQHDFLPQAILRQLVPMLGFFVVAWASKAFFASRLDQDNVLWGGRLIVALGFIVAPLVMLQQGRQYQGDDPLDTIIALYGAFINNVVLAMFFVLGYIFLTKGPRRTAGLIAIVAIATLTHFAQFRILAVFVVVLLIFDLSARVSLSILMASLIVSYAIGLNYIPQFMASSPNSGLRLAFLADVLRSTADTYGVGIGYGTESVRWRYDFPGAPVFTFLPDEKLMTPDRLLEALSTGVENSFAQALLRTGVIGWALFVSAFAAAFPARNLLAGTRKHAISLFAMLFVGCFVNSALESPISAVGFAFVYGYLVALNSRAKALKPIAAARSRDQHQSIHLAIIRSQMQPSIGDIRR